jgi:F-type H+-transporting ATPase subunit epsilon
MANNLASASNETLLQCVVVTPERTVFDKKVSFVALPLYDGELGILPGHSPVVGRLGFGELRTRLGDFAERFYVDGGFVQVQDDVVTILTQSALEPEAIEVVDAEAELKSALGMPGVTEAEAAVRERAITRARARLRFASDRND